MMNKRSLLFAGAAALILYGCGGGGGNPGGSGSNALTQGRSSLNQLVTGRQQTDAQSLQNTLNLFQQAIQQNPGSPDAHLGVAICLTGLVAQQISAGSGASGGATGAGGGSGGSAGSSQPPSPPVSTQTSGSGSTGPAPPAPPGYHGGVPTSPPVAKAGLFWELNLQVTSPFALLNMLAPVADIRYGLLPFYGYPGDDVAGRQQMLTELNTVEQNLQTIEANPNFTTTLPDPSGSGQTVTVGLPEVYLFDAYVNSLRTELALSLAYVRDVPGDQSPPPAPGVPVANGGGSGSSGSGSTAGGSSGSSGSGVVLLPALLPAPPPDLDKDGKLSPNEYLPPSPYLTLRDPAYMKTAQQALQAVADDEAKGITGVFARPADGSGGFLIPNSTDIHQQLANIQANVVPLIHQAATGPVTFQIPQYPAVPDAEPFAAPAGQNAGRVVKRSRAVVFAGDLPGVPGGPILINPTYVSVTIDLAAWFANPPADLKVFAPTYPLDANGYPIYSQAVYPDPTFGGLFPNGLPQNLMF